MPMNSPLDSRQRSAETKRQRTRERLLAAAGEHFATRGWQGTRVEDIAKQAGVSVATAFNHFSKHSLIGQVYLPLFEPLRAAARADVDAGVDPLTALRRHVTDLSALGRENQTLTNALLAAVFEQTANGKAEPGDTNDARNIVPIPEPMIGIIAYGQDQGRFTKHPSAVAMGVFHSNAMMLHIYTKHGESAADTAELIWSQVEPAVLDGVRR